MGYKQELERLASSLEALGAGLCGVTRHDIRGSLVECATGSAGLSKVAE